MLNFKWQEEALAHKSVVLKASRRSGKTTAALKWARSAGQNVLFVTPYHGGARTAAELFFNMYRDEVVVYKKEAGLIVLRDNVSIHFVASYSESIRGLRLDAVAFDDIEYMTDHDIALTCSRIGVNGKYAIFVTHTRPKDFIIGHLTGLEGVHTMTVDYLDLVADGVLTPSQIRSLKKELGEGQFLKDFGPFDVQKATNKSFKHLLEAVQ